MGMTFNVVGTLLAPAEPSFQVAHYEWTTNAYTSYYFDVWKVSKEKYKDRKNIKKKWPIGNVVLREIVG